MEAAPPVSISEAGSFMGKIAGRSYSWGLFTASWCRSNIWLQDLEKPWPEKSLSLAAAGEVCDPLGTGTSVGPASTVSRSQVRGGTHQIKQLSASAVSTPKCSRWWALCFVKKGFATDPGTGVREGTGISLQTSALVFSGIWVMFVKKMRSLMSLERDGADILYVKKPLRQFLLTDCS